MQLFLKTLCGIANSVDPDQTAKGAIWSGSALFAYATLSETLVYEILEHLLYCILIKVNSFHLCLALSFACLYMLGLL